MANEAGSTATPTMALRFSNGKLQQMFQITRTTDEGIVRSEEWRDVPRQE